MAPESEESQGRVPQAEDIRDLGFGSRMVQRSQVRFLNRDGTFNVSRRGLSLLHTLNPYHTLVNISWSRFLALFIAFYFLLNLLFAGAYYLCGPGALREGASGDSLGRFLDAFFFSVQTLSTVGYGGLSPNDLAANLIVTLQTLAGLLFFAMSTGLIFARFSRPVARILYSRQAVIAPYHGITALEFRVVNAYRNQLVNLEATLIFSHLANRQGRRARVFDELTLERSRVTFFPLQWTVVHPIDEASPLRGMTPRDLEDADAEFIVLINAFDETFSQTVHSRSSYKYDETVAGARFADMFVDPDRGKISIDMRKLHEIERVE